MFRLQVDVSANPPSHINARPLSEPTVYHILVGLSSEADVEGEGNKTR